MLAQAVPMGMRSSSAKSRRMGYQVQSTVTSVGPYKLMYWSWGNGPLPTVELLGPECFAADDHGTQSLRGLLFQHAGVGDQVKGGGRPDQGRDRFVGQEVHEQGREEKVFLGDDVGAGPALEGDINIFHREIKVKRGLVCQNVSLRKAAASAIHSMKSMTLRWERIIPLGVPVEPEVKMA